jgi:hypothetical protein
VVLLTPLFLGLSFDLQEPTIIIFEKKVQAQGLEGSAEGGAGAGSEGTTGTDTATESKPSNRYFPIIRCGRSQDDPETTDVHEDEPCDLCDMVAAVRRISELALYVIGSITIVVIIIGGVMYTAAAGSNTQQQNAKRAIYFGVTGLVIVICAWLIVAVVARALGYGGIFGPISCEFQTYDFNVTTNDANLNLIDNNPYKEASQELCLQSTNCMEVYAKTDNGKACLISTTYDPHNADSYSAQVILAHTENSGVRSSTGCPGTPNGWTTLQNWAGIGNAGRSNQGFRSLRCDVNERYGGQTVNGLYYHPDYFAGPCLVAPNSSFIASFQRLAYLVDTNCHYKFRINWITGGLHSPRSLHYYGRAVDVDIHYGNGTKISEDLLTCMKKQNADTGASMTFRVENNKGQEVPLSNTDASHIHLDK